MAAMQRDPESFEDEEDDDRAEEAAAELAAYERDYQHDHSWEMIQEDEFGRLRPIDATQAQRAKRRKIAALAMTSRIRRGMIRCLQLVVDLSAAAAMTDFRPTRAAIVVDIIKSFVRDFFDQNPLSQLGIIVVRNGIAERISELSASQEVHISKLQQSMEAEGAASLQNALEMALSSLKSAPPYAHREILVVFSALSTCDPGNIFDTLKTLKAAKCHVSIVGLAAEVYICKRLTNETGGSYSVATTEHHLSELVMSHSPPPPTLAQEAASSLVAMGFPSRQPDAKTAFVGADCKLQGGAYVCPRCKALSAELPCQCHVCGLTLISSPHLARSYHHLFPVQNFTEINRDALATAKGCRLDGNETLDTILLLNGASHHGSQHLAYCYGCMRALRADDDTEGVVLECPKCRNLFCFDCDAYVHESLHNCPGCECLPPDSGHEAMQV